MFDLSSSITQLIVIVVYHHSPSIPSRSLERRTVFGSSSSSFSPGMPSTPASSPPRKVVTDFATFGAPSTTSVFETAVKSSPFSLAGSNSAFAAIRGVHGGQDEDEDEEDGDTPSIPGRQKIELREGSITLDQVCNSLMSFGLSFDPQIFHRHVGSPSRVPGAVHAHDIHCSIHLVQLPVHSSRVSGTLCRFCMLGTIPVRCASSFQTEQLYC